MQAERDPETLRRQNVEEDSKSFCFVLLCFGICLGFSRCSFFVWGKWARLRTPLSLYFLWLSFFCSSSLKQLLGVTVLCWECLIPTNLACTFIWCCLYRLSFGQNFLDNSIFFFHYGKETGSESFKCSMISFCFNILFCSKNIITWFIFFSSWLKHQFKLK